METFWDIGFGGISYNQDVIMKKAIWVIVILLLSSGVYSIAVTPPEIDLNSGNGSFWVYNTETMDKDYSVNVVGHGWVKAAPGLLSVKAAGSAKVNVYLEGNIGEGNYSDRIYVSELSKGESINLVEAVAVKAVYEVEGTAGNVYQNEESRESEFIINKETESTESKTIRIDMFVILFYALAAAVIFLSILYFIKR